MTINMQMKVGSKRTHEDDCDDDSDDSFDDIETSFSHNTFHESQAGVIQKLAIRNFMGISNMDVQFGPHINFIIGKNKVVISAILKALFLVFGGDEDEANDFSFFVQNGHEYAQLEVMINNCGFNSFQEDIFKQSIHISRILHKDCKRSFEIRSANGELISTDENMMKEMLDALFIEIKNPLMDVRKDYLARKGAKENYRFFFKGMQLHKEEKKLHLLRSNSDRYQKLHIAERQKLVELEQQRRTMQQPIVETSIVEEHTRKCQKLDQELAYAHAKEIKEKLDVHMQHIDEYEKEIKKNEVKIEELQKGMQVTEELLQKVREKLGNRAQKVMPKAIVVKTSHYLEAFQGYKKNLKEAINKSITTRQNIRNSISILQLRIDSMLRKKKAIELENTIVNVGNNFKNLVIDHSEVLMKKDEPETNIEDNEEEVYEMLHKENETLKTEICWHEKLTKTYQEAKAKLRSENRKRQKSIKDMQNINEGSVLKKPKILEQREKKLLEDKKEIEGKIAHWQGMNVGEMEKVKDIEKSILTLKMELEELYQKDQIHTDKSYADIQLEKYDLIRAHQHDLSVIRKDQETFDELLINIKKCLENITHNKNMFMSFQKNFSNALKIFKEFCLNSSSQVEHKFCCITNERNVLSNLVLCHQKRTLEILSQMFSNDFSSIQPNDFSREKRFTSLALLLSMCCISRMPFHIMEEMCNFMDPCNVHANLTVMLETFEDLDETQFILTSVALPSQLDHTMYNIINISDD